MAIEPLTIKISEEKIEDLRSRLKMPNWLLILTIQIGGMELTVTI